MTHMTLASIQRTADDSTSFSMPQSLTTLEAAILLLTACPTEAKQFALSMHERAAWGLESDQIDHWARIVTQLSQLELALQAD